MTGRIAHLLVLVAFASLDVVPSSAAGLVHSSTGMVDLEVALSAPSPASVTVVRLKEPGSSGLARHPGCQPVALYADETMTRAAVGLPSRGVADTAACLHVASRPPPRV